MSSLTDVINFYDPVRCNLHCCLPLNENFICSLSIGHIIFFERNSNSIDVVIPFQEIGVIVTNCSCMGKDLAKIFDVYWQIGGIVNGSLPKHWPERDNTRINSSTPFEVKFNNGTEKSLT